MDKSIRDILKDRDSLVGAIESLIKSFEEENEITVKEIKISSNGLNPKVEVKLSNIFE